MRRSTELITPDGYEPGRNQCCHCPYGKELGSKGKESVPESKTKDDDAKGVTIKLSGNEYCYLYECCSSIVQLIAHLCLRGSVIFQRLYTVTP
jgi:hypothetical protein